MSPPVAVYTRGNAATFVPGGAGESADSRQRCRQSGTTFGVPATFVATTTLRDVM